MKRSAPGVDADAPVTTSVDGAGRPIAVERSAETP